MMGNIVCSTQYHKTKIHSKVSITHPHWMLPSALEEEKGKSFMWKCCMRLNRRQYAFCQSSMFSSHASQNHRVARSTSKIWSRTRHPSLLTRRVPTTIDQTNIVSRVCGSVQRKTYGSNQHTKHKAMHRTVNTEKIKSNQIPCRSCIENSSKSIKQRPKTKMCTITVCRAISPDENRNIAAFRADDN